MTLPGANISAPARRVLMMSGQYTGDGNDDRNINIGYDLTNKHVLVFTKAEPGQPAVWRGYYHVGDVSSFFNNVGDVSNQIQTFYDQGFQIGSGVYANQDTVLYRYIVFWLFP